MDDELVASGRYARLEVAAAVGAGDEGRPGGRHSVTVGYLDVGDGSIVVAATEPDARWAQSLAERRRARISIGSRSFEANARELMPGDPARARAVRDLILRYGTPSEGLGRGPVFRLDPAAHRDA